MVSKVDSFLYISFIHVLNQWKLIKQSYVLCTKLSAIKYSPIFKNTIYSIWGLPGSSMVKNLPTNAGDVGLIPGGEDCLEKGMATHSSILAQRIPWTEASWSPWGHKELDMTEQITLSLLHFI